MGLDIHVLENGNIVDDKMWDSDRHADDNAFLDILNTIDEKELYKSPTEYNTASFTDAGIEDIMVKLNDSKIHNKSRYAYLMGLLASDINKTVQLSV